MIHYHGKTMDNHSGDSGPQLVLDNRKLVIAFALLIVICGSFFVIGFMEGKRQGVQRASQSLPVTPAQGVDADAMQTAARPATSLPAPKEVGEKAIRESLDWYSSVNKRGNEPVKGLAAPKTPGSAPAPASGAAESRAKAPGVEPAARVTYAVQVGAFRQRKEAEIKAALLKARKYQYVIEPSGGADQLFLLKVGKFSSRADAVAMQNRLRKDGFKTFIKTGNEPR